MTSFRPYKTASPYTAHMYTNMKGCVSNCGCLEAIFCTKLQQLIETICTQCYRLLCSTKMFFGCVILGSFLGICQPCQYVKHKGNGQRDAHKAHNAVGECLVVVHPTISPLPTFILPVLTRGIKQSASDERACNRSKKSPYDRLEAETQRSLFICYNPASTPKIKQLRNLRKTTSLHPT